MCIRMKTKNILTEQPSQVFDVLPDLNHFDNFLRNGSNVKWVLMTLYAVNVNNIPNDLGSGDLWNTI